MSPTAIDELVSNLSGPIVPTSMTQADEGIDLSHFLLDVVRSVDLDIDVAGSIIDGSIERSIDGASTLTVTFHDPQRILQGSAMWNYTIDVELDGYHFRLVQVQKEGDDLTLTFEDRIVAWLRTHKKPLKMSRNKVTRAEFIKMMVDEVKADDKAGEQPIIFRSPQLKKKQPITKPKKPKERRQNKDGGIHIKEKITVQGHAATKKQKENTERILDVADHLGCNRFEMIAGVMCINQESGALTTATNGVHVGLFQQDPKYWPATRNPEKDATAFFKAIKKNYRPGVLSLPGLIESVQGSGQPNLYAQWESEARKTVAAYLGTTKDSGGGSSTYDRTYAKSYQFTRGLPNGPKHENSWQAALRLAEEVRWRFFIVGNTVYYYTDEDLLKAKPVMVIDEQSDGILGIDYDWDVGKEVSEATINCRAERWLAHPGEVVVLDEALGPAAGRWLVQRITRPLFSDNTTIELYVPQDPLKEPAPELNTVTKDRGGSKSTKHRKAGMGSVSILPGANRSGVQVQQIVIDFLNMVKEHTREDIAIKCGTNHNQYVLGTHNQSDHWTGNAVDIDVGGDARTSQAASSKGDNIATAALIVLGIPRATAHQWAVSGALNFGVASNHMWRGHRVQVGWKTMVGGNHYNHVHIGVN